MTHPRTHDMLAHPPPFEMDLVDADRVVGWIVGDTIGFRGFENETEATHAAWIAHRTLARRLARTLGTRPVPVDIEPLTLARSSAGDSDTILASNRRIAALIRPGGQSRAGDSFGFELSLPSPHTELQVRGVAYLIYRTLRKSGVRWALWRGESARRAQTIEEADVAAARLGEPVRQPRRRVRTLAGWPFGRLRNWLRLTTEAIRRFPLDSTTASH